MIVELVVLLVLVVAAICLQTIPITAVYTYPDSVAMDAPTRVETIPIWALFLLLLLVSAVFSLAIWDRSSFAVRLFLRVVGALVTTVSVTSILCSVVHIVIATPRPDSIAQCGTVNVSYHHCSQVLSGMRLASQFQSFPAAESAELMAAAVMLTVVVDILLTEAAPLVLVFKPLVIACPILGDALLLASGCYHITDVVAGSLLGFLVAHIGRNSLVCDLQRLLGKAKNGMDVSMSLSVHLKDSIEQVAV
jgi:membrane-associated phospholipid phosphatase